MAFRESPRVFLFAHKKSGVGSTLYLRPDLLRQENGKTNSPNYKRHKKIAIF